MIINEHFKGNINSIILYLLSQDRELYGYEIVQLVKEKTDGAILFTEGAIYPSLHKLETKGLIKSRKEKVAGRTRKYYSITEKGKQETGIQIDSLRNLYQAMVAIFGSKISGSYGAE